MIPANRAKKCPYHGLEYDATISPKCPACHEHDKREELEKEAREAFQTQQQMLKTLGHFTAMLLRGTEND